MEATPSTTADGRDAGTQKATEYATVEQLLAAAMSGSDLEEEDVTDVFGGLTIRIRALSAAQRSNISQMGIDQRKGNNTLKFADIERMQFKYGVLEPKLSDEQIRSLHIKSGPSFQKVVKAISKLSNIDEDSLAEAEEDFREPGE